jgi:hypothetical protein
VPIGEPQFQQRRRYGMNRIIALASAALLAGCASYEGRGLEPGKAVARDVEALMGAPAERVALTNGEHVWFYPRQPYGRQTFAVRLAPDGTLRAIEQRLSEEYIAKLIPGVSTVKDVRELFGPPWKVTRFERQERDTWEWRVRVLHYDPRILVVQYSYDGVVREVMLLRDPVLDMPSLGRE